MDKTWHLSRADHWERVALDCKGPLRDILLRMVARIREIASV